MPEIKIENLTKTFASGEEQRQVLRGVTATFDTSEVTVILGRSGGGKTVLLRVMSGLLAQTSGTVTLPEGYKPGFVFQEPRLMPWLDVWDNVNFGLEKEQIDEAKTRSVLELVALTGQEHSYPTNLSGGMAHRVALARMLICRPKLIFMDEPFSALDYFTRAMLQGELLRIKGETGMGVVFVTHNLDEAVRIADKIFIMKDGRLDKSFALRLTPSEREGVKALELKNEILQWL